MRFSSLAFALAAFACARPARAACAVRGDHADLGRTVTATSGDPVIVIASDVPATARPWRKVNGGVEVEGPLRFQTIAEHVPYRLTSPVVARPVELDAGVSLENVRSDRSNLVADARSDSLVVVRGVPVPCGAAGLDAPSADEAPMSSRVDPLVQDPDRYEANPWFSSKRSFFVFASPGSGPFVQVEGQLELYRVLEKGNDEGSWVHVIGPLEGGIVDGYVARSLLERQADGVGIGGLGMVGCGVSDRGGRLAIVAAGTTVFAKPGERPWATVPKDVELEVSINAVGGWARIQVAPGIREVDPCSDLQHAWILASSLSDPPSSEDDRRMGGSEAVAPAGR